MLSLPFGTWPSPIAAADLARFSVTITYVRSLNGVPYWLESRPNEQGRYVIVTPDADGGFCELTPTGFNARTRVHEYGGVPYTLQRGAIYFSNFADQRLYAQRAGAEPAALTPEGYRYADCQLDASGTLLFCVREDHTAAGEPKNAIVAVPTAGGSAGTVLFGESDFVAYPRVSADGKRLVWLAWNHPDMPWDGPRRHVLCVRGGRSRGPQRKGAMPLTSLYSNQRGTRTARSTLFQTARTGGTSIDGPASRSSPCSRSKQKSPVSGIRNAGRSHPRPSCKRRKPDDRLQRSDVDRRGPSRREERQGTPVHPEVVDEARIACRELRLVGKSQRRFKLTAETWAIIERQPRTCEYIFPYDPRSVSAAFTRACHVLGIEDLRFHDLRHEATSRLFERGHQIHEVAQFTLHESWNE
ncbi:tyrosine-type recombinase/integrase [Peristeroidobacter agariperforans]|uniref:tyrosine-type recombinase/integrase n=1 Tax=Peristeroidobacter agariperforans TaxID=268404 RepID=UPI0013005140|nr:tyrosine-type recombinase/integrase [Peristeroidobacter agariperforans]